MLSRSSALLLAPAAAGLAYAGYSRLTSTRQRIIAAARRVVPYEREHARNRVVGQGRGFSKGYSGCGDLWNYVLDVVGAPNSWVNRDSPRRGMKWKVEVNISRPWYAAKRAGAAVDWKRGVNRWPRAGDLVLIGQEPGEMAHVFVVLERLGPRRYRTAEYGAMKNKGVLSTRTFDEEGRTGEWRRHLVGWIDADKIPVDPKYAPGILPSILHASVPERAAAA